MTTPAPLKIGVIGCGRIAQVAHLPAIAKSDRLDLVAVSDPSDILRDGVAARYGVVGHASTDELLARDDLDAVLVAVPDRLHLPLGRAALDAGRHVLVEKPIAATSAEARELGDRAGAAGLVLQVGAMRRHDPGIRWAQQVLPEIGPVLAATMWYRLPAKLRTSTERALFPPIVTDDEVRGHEAAFKADRPTYLLRTHGAHVFDTARFLFGATQRVHAELDADETDLCWTGSLRGATGAVRFEITANAHANYSEGIDVFGSRGALHVRSSFPFYRQASSARVFREQSGEWTAPDFGAVDPYQAQLEAFADAVQLGGPVDPDARDGLEALRLIEATRDSCAAGGTAQDL